MTRKGKFFLFLTLVLTMMKQGAWAQNSEPVAPQFKYIERSWDGTKVVDTERSIKSGYEILTGPADEEAWIRLGDEDDDDHYYVVAGNVKYKTLNVFGKAHLILCDGATLTCWGGIKVEKNNHNAQLFIYGQKGGTGQLIVTNCYDETAGIGSAENQQCGEINIHGGNLTITGAERAAGIGGGSKADGGMLRIYGGKVTATGGKRGAGIGGGSTADGGDFYLYGGEVTATGGQGGAGVGGGGRYIYFFSETEGGMGGRVYAYGGKLTAQGGYDGSGIGTGELAKDNIVYKGELHVYEGATVTATGGKYGAGIGGGNGTSGIKTYIYGGTVSAKGGSEAAGIGGGYDEHSNTPSKGGETHISGGTVRAVGTGYGAGIGGGAGGCGANVSITGGTVVAIAGGKCSSVSSTGGSAIGCGNKVYCPDKDSERDGGILELGSNMMVTAGDAENNLDGVFTSDQRAHACRWRDYVKLGLCPHTAQNGDAANVATTYSIVDEQDHNRYCRYCQTVFQEPHTIQNCPCGIHEITHKKFTLYVPGDTKGSYVEMTSYEIGAGNEFYLPACTTNPDGYVFKGWEMNPDPETLGNWDAVVGYDMKDPGAPVQSLLGQDDATFYARYLYDITDEWTWQPDYSSVMLTLRSAAFDYDKHYTSESGHVTISYETRDNDRYYTASYTYSNNNGYDYQFSSEQMIPAQVKLYDGEDNSDVISRYDDRFVGSVMLQGRELYIDGSWNTICLPFELSAEKLASMLENPSALKKLKSSSFANGVLTLNFEDATYISAGVPYLIKWDVTGPIIGNPSFDDVTIYKTQYPAQTDYVDFVGSFSPVELKANDQTVLFLGDNNTLYYPDADMTIGACRACFLLKGQTASNVSDTPIRSFVLNFGDDETTAVFNLNEKGQMTNEGWFTLDGRQLTGKPTTKGIYIVNGKKKLVK